MGWRTVADVRDHSRASGSDYIVLVMLAERAPDETRIAHPGIERLAADSRVSKSTCRRSLKALEQLGEIEAVAHRKGGRGYATEWRVLVERPADKGLQSDTQSVPQRVSAEPQRVSNATEKGVTAVVPRQKEPNRTEREWQQWLEHYRAETQNSAVRGSKSARAAFAARRSDGYTLADLRLATIGAHRDDYMSRNGFDVPDTILRASNIDRYITLGKRHGKGERRDGLAERAKAALL